mgnify:CR=1 FL=1
MPPLSARTLLKAAAAAAASTTLCNADQTSSAAAAATGTAATAVAAAAAAAAGWCVSSLLVLLAAHARVLVGDVDVELLSALNNVLALARRHVMGNLQQHIERHMCLACQLYVQLCAVLLPTVLHMLQWLNFGQSAHRSSTAVLPLHP